MSCVYFFRPFDKDYGCFSNFYISEFKDKNGIEFNCNEQYFMYRKCLEFDKNNQELLAKIMWEIVPRKVKKLGRQVQNYDNELWNKIRYEIMLEGLRYKFSQNSVIKKKLLDTGLKFLYEASPYDKIWGIGYDKAQASKVDIGKYGQNLLGKALMKVRGEFRDS